MFVLAKRTDEKAHRPGLDLSGDVADTANSKSQLESAVRNPRSPPRVLRFMGRDFCSFLISCLLLVTKLGKACSIGSFYESVHRKTAVLEHIWNRQCIHALVVLSFMPMNS